MTSRASALRNRLRRGPVFESALANVAIAVLGAVTGVLLARLLGSTGRGQLAAIRVPAMMLSGLLLLGLPDAVVHFVRRGESDVGGMIGGAFTMTVISTVTVGVVAALVLPFFLGDLPGDVVRLGQWWMVTPMLTAAGGIPIVAFRAIGREDRWNMWRLAPSVTWVTVVVSAAAVGAGDRLRFVVYTYVVASAGLAIAAWLALRPHVTGGFSIGRSTWRPLLTYGGPVSLTSLPQVMNFQLDQLVLIPFVASDSLGIYVSAVAFSALTAPIVAAFGIVLFPRLSAARDVAEIRMLVTVAFRRSIVVAVLSAGVGIVLAPAAIPVLFGSSFAGAVGVSLILLPAGAVRALAGVAQAALLGLDRTRTVLTSEIAGLVVNVALLAALVPAHGIVGAAVASLLAYSVTLIARVLEVSRVAAVGVLELVRVR